MRHLLVIVLPAALLALLVAACGGGEATSSPATATPAQTFPAGQPSPSSTTANVLAAVPASPASSPAVAGSPAAPGAVTPATPNGPPTAVVRGGVATIVLHPTSPTAQTPVAGPSSPPGQGVLVVTTADNGKTITLSVDQTFLLQLGDGSWSPEVDNQAVVSRVPNVAVVRGAQGIYRAHAAGTAHLSATDGSTTFSITIVVR